MLLLPPARPGVPQRVESSQRASPAAKGGRGSSGPEEEGRGLRVPKCTAAAVGQAGRAGGGTGAAVECRRGERRDGVVVARQEAG